jgi:hypothetical protein
MLIEKNGQPIGTVEDWFRLAPPKSPERHWVDGRSAKEAARAWLERPDTLPREVGALLSTCAHLGDIRVHRAEPEVLLSFDSYRGPRNADLALWATSGSDPLAITVEAKADESFDDLVGDVISSALERLSTTPRSGGVTRVVQLAQSLFPPAQKGQPRITDLRYQLITATAGTLAHAAAIGAGRAVLIVHEFVTTKTSRQALSANHDDLSRFIGRLSGGSVASVEAGVLYGPFVVPGEPLFENPAQFFVGKAVRRLGEPAR